MLIFNQLEENDALDHSISMTNREKKHLLKVRRGTSDGKMAKPGSEKLH